MNKMRLTMGAACIVLLGACTQLSEKDRAMLQETNAMALSARDQASRAAFDAQTARDETVRAAQAAELASEKADRIFREGQMK